MAVKRAIGLTLPLAALACRQHCGTVKQPLSSRAMPSSFRDLAQIRLGNALVLFDEFVQRHVKSPDAATLRGLERRFAQALQIQPSYWSQLKSRARQIGERLARQFEQLSRKPPGWMDVPHEAGSENARAITEEADGPQDDDERFIVSLVLSYYRRHPQRARTRLLDLLGEVLTPASPPPAQGKLSKSTPSASEVPEDSTALWHRSSAGVAPLKRKR